MKYKEYDQQVINTIKVHEKEGTATFKVLETTLKAIVSIVPSLLKDIPRGRDPRTGQIVSRSHYRTLDARLQVLRKRGLIYFDKSIKQWRINHDS